MLYARVHKLIRTYWWCFKNYSFWRPVKTQWRWTMTRTSLHSMVLKVPKSSLASSC